jgi:anaerobic magnesium-protoporphyrin IX monomethyl ester cyclase
VNEKLLDALAAAGCQQITYGVESGSERVRRQIMHRPVTNQRFRDVFRWTREAGIQITANYMLGLPGETAADLQQTLDLAAELDVLDFSYFVFYPYPGTHLFQVCRERGYLPDNYLDLPANHRQSILDLPDLSKDEIARCYDAFTALRRQRYAHRLGPDAALEYVATATHYVDESAVTG